ncbi:hypothetical protein A3A37_01855 [Candidatus Kaiserbacteria bacterium RIFCSPLOWO2_01_FULL_52_36]|nr:MAG: hypothetical protein A3A37_01855 [Candidatus Kaiserbacteria bacterium RIFCSPLOWO2_01_FULL_52_36]
METLETRKSRIKIESGLEKMDGTHPELPVALEKDGKAKALAFFDIDETLLSLRSMTKHALSQLYPQEADKDELQRIDLLGNKLGHSYRGHDRLIEIYENGHKKWIDPERYWRERYLPNEKDIDGKDGVAHKRAAENAAKYAEIATKLIEEEYKSHPEKFEEIKLKPIFHLAELYQRLGIPMVLMTANPGKYANAIAKILGLADLFLDLATDEMMIGGGKERAMEHLIKGLESKGVKIARDRLIAVGDSIRGDVGTLRGVKGATGQKGVLVLHNRAALEKIQQQIKDDPSLRDIVENIDVDGIVLNEVPVNERGNPRFGGKSREFIARL